MTTTPPWTVRVDRERCIGAGQCVYYAPETFAHDEEARAIVMNQAGDDLETVRTAAAACPTSAITINEGV